jgi:hypothetical protein
MDQSKFYYFWLTWVFLGFGNFLFFRFNKNAGLKRFLFPFVVIFATSVLLYFIWTEVNIRDFEFWIFALISVAIGFLNIKNTKFCNNCGATVFNNRIFQTAKHCPKCEADLR